MVGPGDSVLCVCRVPRFGFSFSGVAQLVEPWFCKPQVAGSSPVAGSMVLFLMEGREKRWTNGKTHGTS